MGVGRPQTGLEPLAEDPIPAFWNRPFDHRNRTVVRSRPVGDVPRNGSPNFC
jgi:hypothetical protein